MKYKFLRSSLRKSVLLGAPLALSIQCDSPNDEVENADELILRISPTEFLEALNNCLADEEACVELCDQVLVSHGYSDFPGDAEIFECRVRKQASFVEVEMLYKSYPMAVGCGVVMVDPESEPTSIGSHYAALAELEASSVYSFVQLARDLRHHGAPAELVRAAVRAVQDEVRHAGQASMLARVWGAVPRPLRRDLRSGSQSKQGDRDLFVLATENAVDGCVHETFGAAIATHQARTATDPFIRSTMKSIARDEMRHAILAEAVDRWARPKLSNAQRQALESVARDAADQLAASQKDAPTAVSELAGFPSAKQARALAVVLEAKRLSRWS